MSKRKTTRVTQRILKKDQQIATAVLALRDYSPSNPDFTSAALREAMEKMDEALAAEQRAMDELARARQQALEVEWAFHELVLGAKRQVIAQYGDDSDQITTLGMKKKSERRYGRPRKNTAGE
ncbi:MAG: hypothetical protein BGO89_05955 [Candidatus Kapaibacterium thiocyanatum]|uniref:Uncharacterized protein n=1 Tax=Candidatus Kapaibacterium thiocyanatum TaxID=1895771 RepID=A0A1M3KZD8_9BACT|nr:MAG: hypothetical protein BGO89_05955 ['Candidatus Kapabacteria' thiocyanatum]